MTAAPVTQIDPLRPTSLADFAGQDAVVSELRIVLHAAQARREVCDHILLSGPPGLGKTTLASIIASELDLRFIPTSGPAIEKPGDVASILAAIDERTLLFIDEIHRMPRACEEILHSAMEDRRLDIVAGEGANARSITIPLPPFVLVGATTQAGLLSSPLLDRFGYAPRLELYTEDTLTSIVSRSADLLECPITEDGARVVAMRSRGTPRIANRLLRRVRDWAQVESIAPIDATAAEAACEAFRIDPVGLDPVGRSLLHHLCTTFAGRPVGLTTLAATVGEHPTTVSEVYEPYLLHLGFLARTPKGRVASPAAFDHLDLDVPDIPVAGTQLSLNPS